MSKVAYKNWLHRCSRLLGCIGFLVTSPTCDGSAVDRCFEARDCGTNQVCISGQCQILLRSCVSDAECDSAEQCLGGFCLLPGRCVDDGQCDSAYSCVDGLCTSILGCQEDKDCAVGQVCGQDGVCRLPECLSDFDCKKTEVCDLARFECVTTSQVPTPEKCNGLDDNKNGVVDEGFHVDEPCDVGTGACHASGVIVCLKDGETSQCSAVPGPASDESCNNLDDDCDGLVDENWTSVLGTDCCIGVGACAACGTVVCDDTQLATGCNAVPLSPAPELCNGIDDNCNGVIDEGYGVGLACENGLGACAMPGVQVCSADGLLIVCESAPLGQSSTEVCDGIDNDCNGLTDEDFTENGEQCGSSVGACLPGYWVCSGGVLVCDTPSPPSVEVCDGVDNDCNGIFDDVVGGCP